MAKYTELFAEYLENEENELPSVFAEIDGFSDLFIGYYADKEIGFETETLFKMKLETYANIFVPKYKQKIDLLDYFLENIEEPTKTKRIVHDMGKMIAYNWVLPFNSNVADPSAKSQTDPSQNVDTENESGFSADEIVRIMEHLKEETQNLKMELLQKFKTLFMMIY